MLKYLADLWQTWVSALGGIDDIDIEIIQSLEIRIAQLEAEVQSLRTMMYESK